MATSALATAFVNIVPGTAAVENYLKGGGLADQAGQAGTKAGDAFGSGFGGALKKLATAGALIAIGKQITDFVGQSISAGNSLYIEFEGVNQVFGKSAAAVQAFAKTAASTAGISEAAALSAAKGFGGFATSAGLAAGEAAKFSIDLTKAAGDMASFYGGGTEASLSAIKSALMGQYEPMLKYNQQLNEAAVRQEAFALKLTNTTDQALTPQQKTLAVQSLLMKGLGVAQGDFVKYADSFDNAQQTMTANFQNMQATLGQSLLPVLGQLVAAINPVIEMAGPLLFQVFQKLIPLFELVTNTISRLMPAMEPIVNIFGSLVDIIVSVLDTALAPLIDVITIVAEVVAPVAEIFAELISSILKPLGAYLKGIVVPIFKVFGAILETVLVPVLEILGAILGAVFEAFMPLVNVFSSMAKKYLPQFTNFMRQYVGPAMEGFAGFVIQYAVPAISWLGQIFANFYVWFLKGFIDGFKWLMKTLQPVWDFLKPIVETLMAVMNIKPIKLSLTTTTDKNTKDFFGGGDLPGKIDYSGLDAGGVDPKAAKKAEAARKKAAAQAVKDRKAISKILASTNDDITNINNKYNDAVSEANKKFTDASAKIFENYNDKVSDLTTKRDADLAASTKEHTAKIAQIQNDFTKKLTDIVQQSKDRLRSAFQSVTAVDVGKTFADLGAKSVDNVIIKLQRGLKKAKDLVANAAALANAGFSQTFIEQVIAQGPDTGNAFAQALLDATPDARAQLQALFLETEATSAHGMDGLAQTMYEKTGLATEALRTLYAQTEADLTAMLDAETLRYAEEQAKILATFNTGIEEANTARDEALADANKTLTEALADATTTLNESMAEVEKDLTEKLSAYKGKLKAFADEVDAIKARIAEGKAPAPLDFSNAWITNAMAAGYQVSATGKLVALASGGYVDSPTPALVGEAGPEVVTPLKDFERMMGLTNTQTQPNITYIAAPNQSLDAEQALFTAIRRAKAVGAW